MQGAEVVISMLPASKHVEGLYLGEDLLGKIPASALVIECSTIAPDSAAGGAGRRGARHRHDRRARVGGTGGAPARSPSSSAACPPRWSAPVRCWKNGQEHLPRRRGGRGPVAKICNNMLLGILMAGTSEALALGVANGLDPKVLSDIIAKSSGRNWATELYNPGPA